MKITHDAQIEGQELLKTLVEKAWESDSFKDKLLKNPEAAIQEVTGKSVTSSSNKKIVVEDQSNESIIYFNIPAEPNFDQLELSNEQSVTVSAIIT